MGKLLQYYCYSLQLYRRLRYKHRCNKLSDPFPPMILRHRKIETVENGASSDKTDYVAQNKNVNNFKTRQNTSLFQQQKVETLLTRLILLIVGVA